MLLTVNRSIEISGLGDYKNVVHLICRSYSNIRQNSIETYCHSSLEMCHPSIDYFVVFCKTTGSSHC